MNRESMNRLEEMRGNAMYPAIREGWLLLIDWEDDLQLNDYVRVEKTDGDVLIRELVAHSGDAVELARFDGGTARILERIRAEDIKSIQHCTAFPPNKRSLLERVYDVAQNCSAQRTEKPS